ncbi:MAG: GNAT family N-acetyltransferase [Acidobacteriaceae bacterium]|nr:GNAT family N-acetyltransferase [Acidobacteriaceae bacterium]
MIHSANVLELDVAGDIARLNDLAGEWSALARALPNATPFQTPEWLLTWWKHFGSGELRAFIFRRERALAGIVPCFLHHWEGRRQLTLLGSGISDYLEPLFLPECQCDILESLSAGLHALGDWDLCCWQDLDAGTPLGGLTSPLWGTALQHDTPCTEIRLMHDWTRYFGALPRGLRRNLRRYADKARQIVEPRFFTAGGFQEALMNDLIRLHRARWSLQGESGMIVANRSAQFLREVALRLASARMLRFFGLELQQRVVALILSFPYKNVLFSYLSGFDPEYQQYGFGKLLLQYSLQHAFENGFTSWNFLRGSEPYKLDWGARIISKRRLVLAKPGV